MASIRALVVLQTLVVSAALLQQSSNVRSAGQTLNASEVGGDWQELTKAFNIDQVLIWEACESKAYKEYYKSLLREHDDFRFADMKLSPNIKILIYGHSFMRQILENIVIANKDTFTGWAIHGEPIQSQSLYSNRALEHTSFSDSQLDVFSFSNGASITRVDNFESLQRADNATNLVNFMKDRKFDVAFYMNPHPLCFWTKDCLGGKKDKRGGKDDYEGPRDDVAPLWDAIVSAMGLQNVYEVEAWSSDNDRKPDSDYRARPDHIIKTKKKMTHNPCNQHSNCSAHDNSVAGHQCQPGLLALPAMQMVKASHAHAPNQTLGV